LLKLARAILAKPARVKLALLSARKSERSRFLTSALRVEISALFQLALDFALCSFVVVRFALP
jgi:hypothetical protein